MVGRIGPPRSRFRWWSPQPPPHRPPLSVGRAYCEVLVVFGVFFAAGIAVAAFSLAGPLPSSRATTWAGAVPADIGEVSTTVLCILVPVLLVQRRGASNADLGLTGTGLVPVRVGIRMAGWALVALIAGSLVTSALATGHARLGRLNAPDLTFDLLHTAQAGFIEEIVVLAFVVTTLEQARRPLPEITAVALILRLSYHIYYGPGVVGILLWASVFLWLFLRFRSIVPLIVIHSAWDVLIVLAAKWKPVAAIELLLWIALLLTSIILWLTDRGPHRTSAGQQLAPPGWYADPAGSGDWRWWDGHTWSPPTHPPTGPQ